MKNHISIFWKGSRLLAIVALLLGARPCLGDSTLVIQGPNGPIRITSTGSIKITPAGPGAAAAPAAPEAPDTNQDFFNAMVNSAASVDMDSPVTARAEFDPPVVPVGGRAIYRIVLNSLDENTKAPDVVPAPPGLTVTPGGHAQIYQMAGAGRLQPETTLNFRAVATNIGTYSMPAFTVLAYGKPVQVPEAQLVVVVAGSPGVHEAPHLILYPPAGNTYVGQTLSLPVVLIDPGDGSVFGFSQVHVNGEALFSEQTFAGMRHETIQHDGQAYPAFVQDATVTPMREGHQTLIAQAECSRNVPGQAGMYGGELIDSDGLELNILPLPTDGRLPGFTGAVGQFHVDPPKLSTNVVRAGDPVKLAVLVRGTGNLGRLSPPQVPPEAGWQTFPPVSDNAPPMAVQQRGFAAFEYTLIPMSGRLTATPAIPFSSFDPTTGSYVNLTIPPVPLTVTGAPGAIEAAADSATDQGAPLALTGLAESPGRSAGSLAAVQQRWWFLPAQLLPALVLAGLWARERRRRRIEQHPEILLKYRARRGVRRHLKLARMAVEAGDAKAFVTAAVGALREACAPHGAATPEALVCGDVLAELPAAARQGRDGDVVRGLFAAADAARFGGPLPDAPELLALCGDWERALDQLRTRL
jgi:hypothetical protein